MEEFKTYILPSGIRCVLRPVKSQVVYAALMTNSGTRNELSQEHGVAHFLEHMFFKGTSKRKPFHINSLLDKVGGELNAYTAKEETVVHATVLRRDFVKAVDLITDVFYNSTYPQQEIDKERGVIYDEINSYKDNPSEMIFDDFEDIIFEGSSLGRNILGTKKSLRKVDTNTLKEFVDRNYSTTDTVFVVMGNIGFTRFVQVCDKFLGNIEKKEQTNSRATLPEYTPRKIEKKQKTYQTHTILGARGYSFSEPKRVALALLCNILGGPSANSRLNLILREKYGLTYGVECNFATYSDTGVASIYFSCEEENHQRCMELIEVELQKLRTTPLTTNQLARAKKQLIGQLTISSDNNEQYMLNCAKSFMLYGAIDTVERSHSKISAITPELLMEVCNEVFGQDNLTTLIYK